MSFFFTTFARNLCYQKAYEKKNVIYNALRGGYMRASEGRFVK